MAKTKRSSAKGGSKTTRKTGKQPDSAKPWSNPVPFNLVSINTLPETKGAYQTGTHRRRANGINKRFNPKYTGKSESNIRRRVKDHYKGRGNRSVKKYLGTRKSNHLYVRFKEVNSPKCAEAKELQKMKKNVWNERMEYCRKRK